MRSGQLCELEVCRRAGLEDGGLRSRRLKVAEIQRGEIYMEESCAKGEKSYREES